jgi:hypothetical protein
VILKLILDFINDQTIDESEGWYLLFGLGIALFLRKGLFTLNFNIGLESALRLCGAIQYLGFSKMLRLANPNDNALGQLVTLCTSDQERVGDAVINFFFFIGKNLSYLLFFWFLVIVLCHF